MSFTKSVMSFTKTRFIFFLFVQSCYVMFVATDVDTIINSGKTIENVMVTVQQTTTTKDKTTIMKTALEDYQQTAKGVSDKIQKDTNKVKSDEEKHLKGINIQFLKGLDSFVKGMHTKNKRRILIGTMNMASALSSTFGIYGLLTSKILTLMVKSMDIYGDITTENLLNPTEIALQDHQISNLELDVAGAKEYFDDLINPITLPGKKDEKANDPQIKSEISIYSESEAEQAIRNAQEKLGLYGKLIFLIEKYCKNKGDEGSDIKNCLKVIKIYCTLSQTHVAFLELSIKRIESSEKEIPIKKQRDSFTKKFVEFISKRQKRDNEVLHFLTDPMKYFDKTDIMYELYTKQDEYGEIIDHLLALRVNDAPIFNDKVVLCAEEKLQGLCREISPEYTNITKIDTSGAFDTKTYEIKLAKTISLEKWPYTKSVFIPPKLSLTFTTKDRRLLKTSDSITEQVVGPFYGLAVYSSMDRLMLPDISVAKELEVDRTSYVRICTETSSGDRWCDTISHVRSTLSSFNGVNIAQDNLVSINIPEDFDAVLEGNGNTVIPIFGPFTLTGLKECNIVWKNLKLKRIILKQTNKQTGKTKAESKQAVTKDDPSSVQVVVSEQQLSLEEMAKLDRGLRMVVACTKKYGQGLCKQIESTFSQKGKWSSVLQSLKKFQAGCNARIHSIKVPEGKMITIIEQKKMLKELRAGPYVGPLLLNFHESSLYQFIIENTQNHGDGEKVNIEDIPKSLGEAPINPLSPSSSAQFSSSDAKTAPGNPLSPKGNPILADTGKPLPAQKSSDKPKNSSTKREEQGDIAKSIAYPLIGGNSTKVGALNNDFDKPDAERNITGNALSSVTIFDAALDEKSQTRGEDLLQEVQDLTAEKKNRLYHLKKHKTKRTGKKTREIALMDPEQALT